MKVPVRAVATGKKRIVFRFIQTHIIDSPTLADDEAALGDRLDRVFRARGHDLDETNVCNIEDDLCSAILWILYISRQLTVPP